MTMNTNTLRSEDVSQDTSGSPLEGEGVVSANNRGTATKPTHKYPPHITRMNETDLRSHLPVHIYPVLELALDLCPVFCRITTPYRTVVPSISPSHALVYFALVCSICISIFHSRNVFFPPGPHLIVIPFTLVLPCNALHPPPLDLATFEPHLVTTLFETDQHVGRYRTSQNLRLDC